MKELSHLNKYFLKYKYHLLGGVVFVTISNLFGVYPAQVIRIAIDLIVENISLYRLLDGGASMDRLSALFLGFFLLILMLAILKGVFMFFMRQTIIVMSRHIEYDLKNEIYSHYQQLSLAFYRRNNTGDLMNRVTEDVSRVRMYIGPAIMYTVNLVVLFILVVGTMYSIDPKLTFYSLLPLPFLVLSIYLVHSLILQKSEKIQSQLSSLTTYVQEMFSGIRVLKAYSREDISRNEFANSSEQYKTDSLDLAKTQALFFPSTLLLIGCSTLLTIYVGGKETINGNITPGNIAEFMVYVNMLTWPVTSLGWVSSLVQRAAASQKRINEFLQTEPEIIDAGVSAEKIIGNLEFRNVSFTYPDTGIIALSNISFTIEPGKSLAILGRTGSGKTTIANLCTRMYDVTSGEILIDGKPIRNISLHSLRQQIGFVPQEVFLFSDTIEGNIAFGVDKFNRENVYEAAKKAAIFSNIMEFPQQFETRIGERGITLSGGQKQRVSIARALIKQPQLLVFDDCLSAVDTKTEEEILRNLGTEMKGKTTIMISHRVSTIKNADKIIVLDKGHIAEEGSHQVLMKKAGIYKELYEKQLLEEAALTNN